MKVFRTFTSNRLKNTLNTSWRLSVHLKAVIVSLLQTSLPPRMRLTSTLRSRSTGVLCTVSGAWIRISFKINPSQWLDWTFLQIREKTQTRGLELPTRNGNNNLKCPILALSTSSSYHSTSQCRWNRGIRIRAVAKTRTAKIKTRLGKVRFSLLQRSRRRTTEVWPQTTK